MIFSTEVYLSPTDSNAQIIMRAMQYVACSFLEWLDESHFPDRSGFLAVNLHFVRFDEKNIIWDNLEYSRIAMRISLPSTGDNVQFFCCIRGDSWFLSQHGEGLDSPAEVFYSLIEECKRQAQLV